MRHLSAGVSSIIAAPAQSKLRFYGYTAKETNGQPAVVNIYNGVNNGGALLATINLAARESASAWSERGGTVSPNGIFIERVSGDAEVAVYFRN